MNYWTHAVAAVSATIAVAPAAQAQTAAKAPAATAAKAPATPAKTSAAPEAAWQLLCQPAPAATATPAPAAQPCSLVQNLVAGEQKQRLLTVLVQRTAQSGHSMTVALPHGLLFPAGVTLQIDEAAERALVVQTSDQNGAYTGTPIDAATLTALKAGKTLKVGFTGGNGQKIVIPVTLKDFPAGLVALDKTPLPVAPAPAPAAAAAKPKG